MIEISSAHPQPLKAVAASTTVDHCWLGGAQDEAQDGGLKALHAASGRWALQQCGVQRRPLVAGSDSLSDHFPHRSCLATTWWGMSHHVMV